MNNPIRILHVIGVMNRGGAETMIMNIYRNIDRSKVQFDFVVHTNEIGSFDDEIKKLGGKIFHCPKLNVENLLSYKNWWVRFFQNDGLSYRVVHGHIGSTASIYLKAAKDSGKYTIAHSHSSGTDYSLKSFLYKLLSYNTRNIADYFFACSYAAGVDRYGKKIAYDKQRYKILNNAIDTSLFGFNENIRKEIRNQFGLTENDLIIGHVGRFTSEKNHKFILKIFSNLLKNHDSSKLILVGDGPLRNEIENLSKELNINNKVIFTGVRKDVNYIMQAFDVLLFPSIYEGLPVTLIEAQSTGLPCVISNKIPEDCILTNNLIHIVNLEDDISKWVETILDVKNITRNGRENEIKEAGFDIKATAKWLEEFYGKC